MGLPTLTMHVRLYGKGFQMSCQREKREQIRYVNWFKNKYLAYNRLISHFANGGKRDIKTAITMKLLGVLQGQPDLLIAVPNLSYHGLFIEMKPAKDMSKSKEGRKLGSLSAEQKEVFKALIAQGYRVAVANGCEEAKAITSEYLNDVPRLSTSVLD